MTDVQRFEDKYIPEPNSGCWLWTGSIRGSGYGYFRYQGRNEYPHRFAYMAYKGSIPAGMEVCHRCDERSCVNPDHLFIGTRQDNIRDMIRKGRCGWQKSPELYVAYGRRVGLTQKGEMHSRAKLSSFDVDVIRYLLGRGSFVPDIAAVFGVHPATISDVLHGRAWND